MADYKSVPFDPSLSQLSSLVSSINEAISQYESAADKTVTLQTIALASQKLIKSVMEPRQYLISFHFQPHKILCVRLAIEMNLFDHMPLSGPFTPENLVTKTGTDLEFTGRILRALGVLDILEEVDENTYQQTMLSREWTNKCMQSYTKHQWDNVLLSMSSYMDFFNAMGFVSPSDPTNTPYAFARGVKDMDFFTLLQKDQKASKTFNEAMTSLKGHGKIGSSYDFGSLQVTSNDDVVLVDVGGGRGQSIESIYAHYPDIKGKFVLQDLPSVIEAGERVCPPDVEVQPYNFFTQVQPVKGAVAYLYKCILHDWPDAECTTILQNLAPAMRGYNSKLLICDVVISDTRPDAQKVLYDINMIFLAGKERSVKQWERLLRGGGFRIERIVGLENPGTSIIEAVLIE